MKDLKGKTAVITGGATGIGKAVAFEFAKDSMNIVIASTNQERLAETAKEIEAAGAPKVLPIVCDVSDRSSVKSLHDQVAKTFGPVDVLVLNAGVTTSGEFARHRERDWDWVYDVVLGGVVNFVQLYYPEMYERKSGHIVITGSQAGMVPNWFTLHGPYTSAKSAVMALGAALQAESQEHGVGITNVIVAGTVTDIMKSERSRPEKYGDALVSEVKKREARRIPASDTAQMIVEGIKENKLWVATHPELKDLTKGYFDHILAAYDR
ncbi:NAD(P)-binding protein [Rhizodiscina lignyota]|uniref:NAD(P)-binding protein n=1 Tax=Rhizodiscina lignyota TaxID=1504668 RepID=A0A9P4ICY3_9PEZI|nr:NAD(P)-binding protein [Rhizodiscina lignyota]